MTKAAQAKSWDLYVWSDGTKRSSPDGIFPLSVSSNGRYLQTAGGAPFLLSGDTAWSLIAQCTDEQIDTYLEDRASRGMNAVLFEAPNAHFSTQTPRYNDIDGDAPFTSTSYTACSWTSLNEDYWDRVDYTVNAAKALGMLCLITPAYMGFGGGSGVSGDQGWDYQVAAASDGDLQAYGALLANRYTQGNVLWVMGGDFNGNIVKNWQIAAGIRSVRPGDLFTFHGSRTNSGYSQASGQTGFNVNCTYSDGTEYTYCATEYARSPPLPFFHLEGWYEGDSNLNAQGYRRQMYATLLSGGCGHLMGQQEIWGFGGYGSSGSAAAALASYLNTTLANDVTRAMGLFAAYAWHLLEPKTDTSLVTTSLGSGSSRIIAARASDGSFAMIWTPSEDFTVDLSAMTSGSVRGRWFDPTAGSYSSASGSPYGNTGTQGFTAPGERVLVLDAA